MKRFFSSFIVTTILIAGLSSVQVFAQEVDCDALPNPESLQARINSGDNFITFEGTCEEDITISRDGVTLQGTSPALSIINPGPGTAVTEDNVVINGATRVRLRNLTILGGSGISLINGAFADFVDVTVTTPFSGVVVVRSSGLRLIDSTVARIDMLRPASSAGPFCVRSLSVPPRLADEPADLDTWSTPKPN